MNAIVVRRALPDDAAAIAQVRIAAWRSTYTGMIPEAYLAAMKVGESTVLWQRVLSAEANTTSTFVAEEAGGVIGFSSGLMLREPKFGIDAELSAIYLRQDRQRTGIGRRLVGAVVSAQRVHGATGLLTWVIAGNKGARAFYEQLGAEFLVEQPFQWDGMDLVEAGYGWRDLDVLAAVAKADG
ncbi:MAG: GNAT family N-acetyltransferase [Aromatoleum sp.]|nr:GNAT family N-acetyltransferase [Aromatoleum sp.]